MQGGNGGRACLPLKGHNDIAAVALEWQGETKWKRFFAQGVQQSRFKADAWQIPAPRKHTQDIPLPISSINAPHMIIYPLLDRLNVYGVPHRPRRQEL